MRHKKAPQRKTTPDSQYNSITLAKFINTIMRRGKKVAAQKIVYGALHTIAGSKKDEVTNALDVFNKALKNVGPTIETRSKRVGGANYQIPQTVRPERRQSLAFRWLIRAAQSKKGKAMAHKLAEELLLASEGEGDAMKKKMDVQRMAEANRAFAHFAR